MQILKALCFVGHLGQDQWLIIKVTKKLSTFDPEIYHPTVKIGFLSFLSLFDPTKVSASNHLSD